MFLLLALNMKLSAGYKLILSSLPLWQYTSESQNTHYFIKSGAKNTSIQVYNRIQVILILHQTMLIKGLLFFKTDLSCLKFYWFIFILLYLLCFLCYFNKKFYIEILYVNFLQYFIIFTSKTFKLILFEQLKMEQ